MKNPLRILALFPILAAVSARADLPSLTGGTWNGYFFVSEYDDAFFGVTTQGTGQLHILSKKGEIARPGNPITIDFRVLENRPNGEIIRKPVEPADLSTEQQPVLDPKEPVVFNGKSKGDAIYQARVTPLRDGFSATGTITEKGTLTLPVEFGIDLVFEPFKNVKTETEAQRKNFERMTKKDEVTFVTAKGEKRKFDIVEEANLAELFPQGVREVVIECERYEGLEFEITASEGSRIRFRRNRSLPVYDALRMFWTAAPGADAAKESLTVVGK